jgi:hypothetical protein
MSIRCRLRFHKFNITSANISGHQSYRQGYCVRCDERMAQPRRYFGGADGSWQHWNETPCTHGSGGVAIPACMRCSINRDLIRGAVRRRALPKCDSGGKAVNDWEKKWEEDERIAQNQSDYDWV